MDPASAGAGVPRRVSLCAAAALVEVSLAMASPDAWARLRGLPGRRGADLATAVTDVATLAALLAWTWLLVVAALTMLTALPGVARPRLEGVVKHLAPVATRRALLALLGVGALLVPAPVAADRLGSPQPVASAGVKWGEVHGQAPGSLLQGLPLPDRPTGQPAADHRPPQEHDEVVVAPGDTLWEIAARSLGPRASTAAIARAWPAWFAANRSAIGDDPDLIVPGTVLRPPPPHAIQPPRRHSSPRRKAVR